MSRPLRRGITPVIAIALLLGMTVAASGGAYSFISQAQQSAQDEATSALSTDVAVRGLRCDDARVEATLKNTGDTSLSGSTLDAFLYRDGKLVTTAEQDISSAAVLQPGGLTTVSLPFVLDPGARYTVELRFPQDDVTVESTCQSRLSALVGHWDFEADVPGQVRDAARSHDGTFENNELDGALTAFDFDTDSGWAPGAVGSHALTMDGQDDRVRVADTGTIDGLETVSISFWVRPKRTQTSSGGEYFLTKGRPWMYGGFSFRFDSRTADQHTVRFKGGDGQGTVSDTASTGQIIPADEWTHIAGTISAGGQTKIYADGELKETVSTVSGFNTTTADLCLGGLSGADPGNSCGTGTDLLNGSLDDIHIYDRMLSAAEIADLSSGADVNRSGLVAEYTFDEGNGTVAHDTSKWVDGQVGTYALRFDGADDYLEMADDADLDVGSGNFTLSTWVRFRSFTSEGQFQFLVEKKPGSSNAASGYWLYYDEDSQELKTLIGDGTDYTSAAETIGWNTGEWHHVAAVTDRASDAQVLYIDGEQVASSTIGPVGTVETTAPLILGYKSQANDRHFNGTLDDVRVYDTALSADQVAALHAATD